MAFATHRLLCTIVQSFALAATGKIPSFRVVLFQENN